MVYCLDVEVRLQTVASRPQVGGLNNLATLRSAQAQLCEGCFLLSCTRRTVAKSRLDNIFGIHLPFKNNNLGLLLSQIIDIVFMSCYLKKSFIFIFKCLILFYREHINYNFTYKSYLHLCLK